VYRSTHELKAHFRARVPSAVFLQSPYSHHYPSWFVRATRSQPLAYAGYGIPLSRWTDGHFRQKLILAATWLLAESQYSFEGFSEATPAARVLLTGDPLMWNVRKELAPGEPLARGSTALLWAPHWSQSWPTGERGFGRWRETLGPLTSWVQKNPGVSVTIRPHPILREALSLVGEEKTFHPEAGQALNAHIDASNLRRLHSLLEHENVKLSTKTLVKDVVESDALLTDGVSPIAYWAPTGKPLAVVRDEFSPSFNLNGTHIVACARQVSSCSGIIEWLDDWEKGHFSNNEEIARRSEEVHPSFQDSPFSLWLKEFNRETGGSPLEKRVPPIEGNAQDA